MGNNTKKITLSAIATAIALIAILIGYYISQISLSMNVLAGVALILPLSQGYHKESCLAFVATSALGAIFANIHILPFVLGSGSFTLISILMYKKNISTAIKIVVDIVWAMLAFWILYKLVHLIIVDFSGYNIPQMSQTTLYIALNAVFVLAFIAYDFILIWIYKYLTPIITKITQK